MHVYVRPEHIRVEFGQETGGPASEEPNTAAGTISLLSYLGAYGEMVVHTAGGAITVRTHSPRRGMAAAQGQAVKLRWDEADVLVFPRGEA